MALARFTRHPAIAALLLLACALLAANPALAASYAPPATKASGTLTIINFVVTSTRSAGGNTFQGYTNDVIYVGDIIGTGHVTGLLIIHADGSGLFLETVTFTGSVLGSSPGTFSAVNTGTFNSDGIFQGRGVIKDGTGGLAGIHGLQTFKAIDPTTAPYSAQVHFDPER